jgi:hypothetical protein
MLRRVIGEPTLHVQSSRGTAIDESCHNAIWGGRRSAVLTNLKKRPGHGRSAANAGARSVQLHMRLGAPS